MTKATAAIVGPGNIGTDLLAKLRAHLANAPRYAEAGLQVVDLTPAAVGPMVCPPGYVGGQEDMIISVALQLQQERETAGAAG